jgi:hypothetical protein
MGQFDADASSHHTPPLLENPASWACLPAFSPNTARLLCRFCRPLRSSLTTGSPRELLLLALASALKSPGFLIDVPDRSTVLA